jgi:hypothetical protein
MKGKREREGTFVFLVFGFELRSKGEEKRKEALLPKGVETMVSSAERGVRSCEGARVCPRARIRRERSESVPSAFIQQAAPLPTDTTRDVESDARALVSRPRSIHGSTHIVTHWQPLNTLL